MVEEIIRINTKRKRPLKPLLQTLGSLGFNRMDYSEEALIIEKVESEDLNGKPYLYYRIELLRNAIVLKYTVPNMEHHISRSLDMGLMLLNMFQILTAYYDVPIQSVYSFYFTLMKSLTEAIDSEKMEMYSKLKDTTQKHIFLEKKYNDLVQASAQNARLVVEYERKNEDLRERVQRLEGVGETELQSQLFEWIRTHDGEIDVLEFAKLNNVAAGRVEEGLDSLIKNGFIRKR
ncbi:hypothetical protein H0O01_02360 [Candidatus Micrarchaeota archaeon]|nr:hypothetical protein [Candidatus Micrarchaeota archaeon]